MPDYVVGERRGRDSESQYDQIDKNRPLPPCTLEYLAIQTPEGGRDNALFAAACQFRDAGFSQAEAESYLIRCGTRDGFSESYSRRKLKSAYRRGARAPIDISAVSSIEGSTPHLSAPSLAARSARAGNGGEKHKRGGADPSPVPLPKPIADGARALIETLFDEKDRIAIGRGVLEKDELHPNNGKVDRRKVLLDALSQASAAQLFPWREGVFVRINPVKPRGNSDADVTAYRYSLVEFDRDENGKPIPKEVQYARLIGSPFGFGAIVDSGNISIQGWARVDAVDAKQYAERRAILDDYFSQFSGYDGSSNNPSRYSRLPDVDRYICDKDKSQLVKTGRQELLALNVGPASWDEYEKADSVTEEELRKHDEEVTKRLLGEDRPFPAPMADAAFYGIAGEIVAIIEAGNEPCRESLLGHLLVGTGNMIGWNPWMDQGGEQHLNEFGLFVGPSSIGRKGTAWYLIRRLLLEVDSNWTRKRVRRALQTGEAIIHNIRDPSIKGNGKNRQTDPGISDKRLVIMETEATRFLTVGKRRGNNLFDVVHDCWDSLDPLCCDSKTAAEEATHAHVSLLAHTTREAYLRQLPEEEKTNGSVNRSLILAVYRAKKKARPVRIAWRQHYPDIIRRLSKVLATFQIQREMSWSPEAFKEWEVFYDAFESKTKGGMVSSILDRLVTHVVKVAMIYCALDNSCLIQVEHLRAAIAFCDYCRRSAEWLFGEKTGNRDADRLYNSLIRIKPNGMTRTEIATYVFSKNVNGAYMDELLQLLLKADLVYLKSDPNPRKGPRYLERWYAA